MASWELKTTNEEDIFNLRHASLRYVIERSFGVVKQRFPILNSMRKYPFDVQIDIVYACTALHNFIGVHQSIPDLYDAIDESSVDGSDADDTGDDNGRNTDESSNRNLKQWRDDIAIAMWNDYLIYINNAGLN